MYTVKIYNMNLKTFIKTHLWEDLAVISIVQSRKAKGNIVRAYGVLIIFLTSFR